MTIKTGTSGDDFIIGTAFRDTLWGKDGNDRLFGGAGADNLYGGNGDDTLSPMDVNSSASDGADRLDGGIGTDLVDYSEAAIVTGVVTRIDLANTRASSGVAQGDVFFSVENVRGTIGDDTVYGTEDSNNVFIATWGKDNYDGRTGIDRYEGLGYSFRFDPSGNDYNGALTMQLAYGAEAQAIVGPDINLAAGGFGILYCLL